ncbi:uncharacterized protein LOC116614365 isoform X2 [Nematostella vectensis]|nr:uncharacterized protein LOC116614365 isoform X2 [Nematostella vectensis]XP_048589400.1 uncharacterized protein LOC116614365 isoform X2 [Nematostella vectensis]
MEYEECIDTIQRGQRELSFLSQKLAQAVGAIPTLRNYVARREDLEKKIRVLEEEKVRIHGIITSRDLVEMDDKTTLGENEIPLSSIARTAPRIPGLTLDSQLDVAFLKKKLSSLVTKHQRLLREHKERFSKSEVEKELLECLLEKEKVKTSLEAETNKLKIRLITLKASLTYSVNQMSYRRNQFFDKIVTLLSDEPDFEEEPGDVKENPEQIDDGNLSTATITNSELEDSDQNEEELIIEYTARMRVLFQQGEIEEAALLVAHSPKGCLREQHILGMLKSHDDPKGGRHIMRLYWDSLLVSLQLQKQRLFSWESIEYVTFAVNNDQKQQLRHWMAQNVLEITKDVAKILVDSSCWEHNGCVCGLCALAQVAFEKISCHREVMTCLLRQGRYYGAMNYASKHLSHAEIIDFFRHCDIEEVSRKLQNQEEPFNAVFTVEQVISILMGNEDTSVATNFVKHVTEQGYQIQSRGIEKPAITDTDRETHIKWLYFCNSLLKQGFKEIAEELFAYLVVKDCIQTAKKMFIIKHIMLGIR